MREGSFEGTSESVSLRSLLLIKWKSKERNKQFHLVNKVSSKWQSFGIRLEIPSDRLEGWKMECLGDTAKCWMKVMEYWLSIGGVLPDYPATWEGLYLLLEDVEYTEVAAKLREIVTSRDE